MSICPKCNSELEVKQNRSNKSLFIGCSSWWKSKCDYTASIEKKSVFWEDALIYGNYDASYEIVGSRPSYFSSPGISSPSHEVSKSMFLHKRSSNKAGTSELQVSHIIKKILQRGQLPYSTMKLENVIHEYLGLGEVAPPVQDSSFDIGYTTEVRVSNDAINQALINTNTQIKLNSDCLSGLVFDSHREKTFLENWVPENLGKNSLRWFTPQVSIDLLLQHHGFDTSTGRRADFLFYVPGSRPLIIELDGQEHKQKSTSDALRDSELKHFNYEVIRVSNDEIDRGAGPQLEKLKGFCDDALTLKEIPEVQKKLTDAVALSTSASRLQFALASAMSNGMLRFGEDWEIEVKSSNLNNAIIKAALLDFNILVGAYLKLFAPDVSPPKIKLSKNNERALKISLHCNETPITILPFLNDEEIIVCSAPLPVEFTSKHTQLTQRPDFNLSDKHAVKPLTVFLQTLFRKRAFREMQSEAICNVFRGNDTVALLPTGAGKSIIYQLAGMLLPGVTLVIDPIVALVEDQQLSLNNHGISKVAALTRSTANPSELKMLQQSMALGELNFILMTPERMLIPSFRDALSSMINKTSVSLAVIDEAHCISQWGHSFRFAYLQLTKNLRKHCSSDEGGTPVILALTGTASRIVLKELVAEIGISVDDQTSIIRPSKFDRPELNFFIRKIGHGGEIFSELNEVLESLPDSLGLNYEGFFDSKGGDTNSGIIFTPTVNNRTHGLLKTRDKIKSKIDTRVGIYGGITPQGFGKNEWDDAKKEHAREFKENSSPILVATNAFGMGIDKPNIRWTIHMGLPNSIEAFYQEAGRAGRDRKKSNCILLFSEVDEKNTDDILNSESFREVNEKVAELDQNKYQKDDISRALYFHCENFSSIDNEIEVVKEILGNLSGGLSAQNIQIPYSEIKEQNEGDLNIEDHKKLDEIEKKRGHRLKEE